MFFIGHHDVVKQGGLCTGYDFKKTIPPANCGCFGNGWMKRRVRRRENRSQASDQAFAEGFCDCFRLGVYLKLLVDIFDVEVDCLLAHEECIRNHLVTFAFA